VRAASRTGIATDDRGLQRARGVGIAALVAAILCGGLAGLSLTAPHASAANVSFTLYGTSAGGWSFGPGTEANPGPTIVVGIGDDVTIHMISEDAPAEHGLFIDFNDDGHIELGTDVSSATGLDVTFSFVVPASPGTHYYYCSIHSPSAQGHYAPGAPMYGIFMVRANPSAAFAAPAAGTSLTGGTGHDVVFDLTADDPPSSLTIWANYSYSGGAQTGTIAGPIPGTANPNVLPWTPTGFSATDVRISITARDSRGAEGTSVSEPFEIDSTSPTIAGRLPAPNAGNVPVNANVHVTWSEGMSQAASGAADAFAVQRVSDGAWLLGSVTWSSDATQMTYAPVAQLDPTIAYRVVVNGTARDDSDPGNPFSGPDTWQFTTGSGADTTSPMVQSVVVTPSTQVAGGTVTIMADVMDDVAVASVSARVVGPSFDANLTMVSGGAAWYANRTYTTPGSYSVIVWAVDGTGNAASRSGSFFVSPAPVPAPTGIVAHALGDGTIHMTWSPVTTGTIAGYNVYRATVETGPFTKLTATPLPSTGPLLYVDRGVQPGGTYYYVVTAVDVGGNESPQSVATSARVPGTAPTPPADYTLWIVAALAVAVAAVALLAIVLRRKR